jgi:hypothetical protein
VIGHYVQQVCWNDSQTVVRGVPSHWVLRTSFYGAFHYQHQSTTSVAAASWPFEAWSSSN